MHFTRPIRVKLTHLLSQLQIPQLQDVLQDVNDVKGFVTEQTAEMKELGETLTDQLQQTQDIVNKLQLEINRTKEQLLSYKGVY